MNLSRAMSVVVVLSVVASSAARAQSSPGEEPTPPPLPSSPSGPSTAPSPTPQPPSASSAEENQDDETPAAVAEEPPPQSAAPKTKSSAAMGQFMKSYVSYDAYDGHAYVGEAHAPIAPPDLYAMMGRPDLTEASERKQRERIYWLVGGAVVAAAGIIGGVAEYTTIRDLNECQGGLTSANVAYYANVCTPHNQRAQLLGASFIAGGVVVGSFLAMAGFMTNVEVLPRSEVASLVASYNGSIMRRARDGSVAPGSKANGARLSLSPVVSLNGAGLHGVFTF